MHIWYVHHYGGGPGLGTYDRPYQLARAWQRQGHSATVFIARHHHLLEKDVVPEPEFEIDGVRYISLPALPYAQNGLSRMANIWDFSRNLYSAGRRWGRGVPRPDAVIASSPHPFTIYPARRLARRHGARLVFEIRDIWPLSITEILGTSRLHPFVQMCAAAERYALGHSDLIASVLPRADRYLADRGYGSKAFTWVPNGIGRTHGRPDSFISQEASAAAEKAREWRSQGLPVVIYTGSIGRPNAIDLLIRAVGHGTSGEDKDRCAVLVVGKGEQLEELRKTAQDSGLRNVHFTGVVPKADAIRLLDSADIGYAGLRNIESLFRYGISPNKIADYLGASLPVLLPLAPCGDPVSESGGGIVRKMDTPEAVSDALRELIRLSPEQRKVMGSRGRDYIAREYDYDRIAARYVDAINGISL